MAIANPEDFVRSFAAAWAARDSELFLALWWPEGKLGGSYDMRTALCDRLAIELPIIQVLIGGVVGPTLASTSTWNFLSKSVFRLVSSRASLSSPFFGAIPPRS